MKKKYEKPEVSLSMNGTLEGVFACDDEDSNNGYGQKHKHKHNGNGNSNKSYWGNWDPGWNGFWGKKGN
jgi:hypothetical protein